VYLTFHRERPGLKKLDLTDTNATEALFKDFHPSVIIHCAAERRPDVAQNRPNYVENLNAGVPHLLAELARQFDAFLLYISTDYVFNGTHPPYEITDTPSPLNVYGRSKLDGEKAILAIGGHLVILRVPVLYGDVEYNGESAVNVLLDAVKNSSKRTEMDHYANRYPTNVSDVARLCRDIVTYYLEHKDEKLPQILHFSAQERLTKYDISVLLAELLALPTDHLIPVLLPPASSSADRPKDAHLSIKALQALGFNTNHVKFRDWWTDYFAKTPTH